MIRRILKRVSQVVKEEFEWFKFRIWLKSRAVCFDFAQHKRFLR